MGVDCGTQSTKVVLRDATTGAIVAVGRAPHELTERDDGTREQEPAVWIAALGTAIRDALRGQQFAIEGIGVSGQQHGLVALDVADRPVRAAKLWNDTTTTHDSRERCVASRSKSASGSTRGPAETHASKSSACSRNPRLRPSVR